MSILRDVSVIIPYRKQEGQRERIMRWLMRRYAEVTPELEVIYGLQHTPSIHFRRSEAINNGVGASKRPLLLIADSDVTAAATQLQIGAELALTAPWVIPYNTYHELDCDTTERVLAMAPDADFDWLYRRDQLGLQGSYANSNASLFFITRDNFKYAGGFDERFQAWGPEDQCWAEATTTINGPPERVNFGDVFHLWHPVVPGTTFDNPYYQESCDLWARYKQAAGDRSKMLELVMSGF